MTETQQVYEKHPISARRTVVICLVVEDTDAFSD
jgi:hypothetical protein